MSSTFAPRVEDILRRESASWKERALIAEGKLGGYKRLRECGEKLLAASLERDKDARIKATDELAEALGCLDVVDGPFDVFNQDVDCGGDLVAKVREVSNLGHLSTIDMDTGDIKIDRGQPYEAKLIGLFFQMITMADTAAAGEVRRERGSSETVLRASTDSRHHHYFAAALLIFAKHANLLRENLPMTGASVDTTVRELRGDIR